MPKFASHVIHNLFGTSLLFPASKLSVLSTLSALKSFPPIKQYAKDGEVEPYVQTATQNTLFYFY